MAGSEKPRAGRASGGTAAATPLAWVEKFRGRRVAVVGDLVADEFLYGDIERVSREAPVLILKHRRTEVVPGGGANAVVNLKALGAEPLPVGVVGADGAGERLVSEIERRGIDTSGILVREGYETPSKRRILAGGVHTRRQQVVRVDRGTDAGGVPRTLQPALRRALRLALRSAQGLLISDYGFGAAAPESLEPILASLRRRRFPVLVDSRARVAAFGQLTACTPNQEELERALELNPIETDEGVEKAGRRLLRRTGNRAVLVTRGSQGMCLFERGRRAVHVPAFGSDEVADVTGAGDTVIAVFALALISGAGYEQAARLANYAAGLVVMKMGTATVDRAELARAIRQDDAREGRR